MGIKQIFATVAVGVEAAAVEPAEAPVARAAAPRRSDRLSSVGGASASILGHAGGSNRHCEIPLGIKMVVIMKEVDMHFFLNIFFI